MCATWVPQIIGAVPGIQHGESRVTTVGPYSPNVAMSIPLGTLEDPVQCCFQSSTLQEQLLGLPLRGLKEQFQLPQNLLTTSHTFH